MQLDAAACTTQAFSDDHAIAAFEGEGGAVHAPGPAVDPAVSQTIHFTNVAIYTRGMFGVARRDCKFATLKTNQKWAQYSDAIRVEFLEKGKRAPRSFMVADSSPWLRIVSLDCAIKPASGLSDTGEGGVKRSTYLSCDPRYVTDFEDALAAAEAPILFSLGAGEREGAFLERCKAADGR